MCEILMPFVKMILNWLKRAILAFICGVEGHDDVIIEKYGAKNRKRTFMVVANRIIRGPPLHSERHSLQVSLPKMRPGGNWGR